MSRLTNVANRAFGPETKAVGAADGVRSLIDDAVGGSVQQPQALPGRQLNLLVRRTHFKAAGATKWQAWWPKP